MRDGRSLAVAQRVVEPLQVVAVGDDSGVFMESNGCEMDLDHAGTGPDVVWSRAVLSAEPWRIGRNKRLTFVAGRIRRMRIGL